MNAIGVNTNSKVSQVGSWTPLVRSDSNLAGFFIGNKIMKQIPLTQGKFALVDDADYEWLNQWKWYANLSQKGNRWYAQREVRNGGRNSRTIVRMHRIIMNPPKNMDVDHQNHNGLDNQKHNLRIATRSQNLQNSLKSKNCSSQYKGVCWSKDKKRWQSNICVNKKFLYLGCFDSEIEAAKIYDQKAKEYFGNFAKLNFS